MKNFTTFEVKRLANDDYHAWGLSKFVEEHKEFNGNLIDVLDSNEIKGYQKLQLIQYYADLNSLRKLAIKYAKISFDLIKKYNYCDFDFDTKDVNKVDEWTKYFRMQHYETKENKFLYLAFATCSFWRFRCAENKCTSSDFDYEMGEYNIRMYYIDCIGKYLDLKKERYEEMKSDDILFSSGLSLEEIEDQWEIKLKNEYDDISKTLKSILLNKMRLVAH